MRLIIVSFVHNRNIKYITSLMKISIEYNLIFLISLLSFLLYNNWYPRNTLSISLLIFIIIWLFDEMRSRKYVNNVNKIIIPSQLIQEN